MIRVVRLLTAMFLVSALAACATAKPAIPFDRSHADSIKTIGLLTPGLPKKPKAILATTVGQSFGLIGLLIDAGMQEARDSDLDGLLNGQKFEAEKALNERMKAALEARGYQVVEISKPREQWDAFQPSYDGLPGGVDAYLDMFVSYGYMSAGVRGATPYRPYSYSYSRLVKATDKSVLMEDKVFYNALNTPRGVVTIAPDPDYTFPYFSDIMANPEKATKGVDVAMTAMSGSIGQLLK